MTTKQRMMGRGRHRDGGVSALAAGWMAAALAAVLVAGLVAGPGVGEAAPLECVHPLGNRTLAPFGDVNASGTVNVADAICAVLVSQWAVAPPPAATPMCWTGHVAHADVNCDGAVNVSDAQIVVSVAISGALPAGLPVDAAGCPQSCAPCAAPGGSSCLISGQCVPEADPMATDPCALCEPAVDEAAFSPAPEGWPCGGGQECQGGTCAPVLPGAPTASASAGINAATVIWAAPASDGGSAITGYAVRVWSESGAAPSGVSGPTTRSAAGFDSQLAFTGLSPSVAYAFTVAAVNGVGEGPQSALTGPVVPQCGGGGDCPSGQGCVSGACGACGSSDHCVSGQVCVSGQCSTAAAVGCADGTREGFVDAAAFPDIAACGGTYSGWIDEASAQSICAPGWHVCRGNDAVVHATTFAQARSFSGCFAFDAAHDCADCYATCRGSVGACQVCCVSNYHSDADMAGMGSGCANWPGTASCLSGGRIDSSTNTFGCGWHSSLSGVVCCRD